MIQTRTNTSAPATAPINRGVARTVTDSSYNPTLLLVLDHECDSWNSLQRRLRLACNEIGRTITPRQVSLQDLQQRWSATANAQSCITERSTTTTMTTLEDLLEAWTQLLTALQQEKGVFTEYGGQLERAVMVTLVLAKNTNDSNADECPKANQPNPEKSSSNEIYLSDSSSKLFSNTTTDHHNDQHNQRNHRLRTLLDLLTQSVREHARDPCIECRFVTLLEVLLSYGPHWQPSPQVEAFWVRLLQRIPDSMAPVNFRRKAYRVLVSLSWVPSSKGLLEACSFEMSKHVLQFECPPIQQHMARIGPPQNLQNSFSSLTATTTAVAKGPLPRHDSVNQLLDRLKDETDVCVAITSENQGMGKTTLAGQVASHPSICRVFTVLWLTFDNSHSELLSYDRYQQYLSELWHQLQLAEQDKNRNAAPTTAPIANTGIGNKTSIQWPTNLQRFEEPALRRLRERDCMRQAKEIMSSLIRQHEKSILLVLDNVHDASILSWFRFDDRQSVIVTTPLPMMRIMDVCSSNGGDFSSARIDWALELVSMSVEEAVELFLLEAGLPATHLLGCTTELQSIIQQCGCHPLTVRTMARWFQLKQITAGVVPALQEIVDELELLRGAPTPTKVGHSSGDSIDDIDANDPNMMLFDILSLMMGPGRIVAPKIGSNAAEAPSSLFVLCFAAYVVVFPDAAPLDAVMLLWEQILRMEPLAMEEVGDCSAEDIARYAWRICEGLFHMGVISIVEKDETPCVEVHHILYRDFGKVMAREMDLKETVEDTIADWHIAFVTRYFTRKSRGEDEKHDDSYKYTMENLGKHMFEGKMASTAEIVLGDEHFFFARIDALGWKRGIEVQIEDCILLQHEVELEAEGTGSEVRVNRVFRDTAIMLRQYLAAQADMSAERKAHECAQALFSLAFVLAENGYIDTALEHLEGAEKEAPSSQDLQASILYAIGWCLLEVNKTDHAEDKIHASRQMMEQGSSQHGFYMEMLRLHAHALIETCQYKEAAEWFNEALEKMKENVLRNMIEIGAARYFQGRLLFLMGEKEQAKDVLLDCLKWKTGNGEVSRSLAAAQGMLGDVKLELRLISEAKAHYEAALHTLKELSCDVHHLDYRLLHGKLQLLRNDTKGCKQSFEMVRRTIKESPLLVLDQSAYDLRHIARAYDKLEDLEMCESLLRESLALTDSRTSSLERAWGLVALGDCLVKKNKDVEALSCCKQALEIQIAKLGDGKAVIDSVNRICVIHLSLGCNDQAIRMLKENLERTEASAPDDNERLAGIHYLLGDAYDAIGDLIQAAEYFKLCADTLKVNRGEDHSNIAQALYRLGDVTAAQKNIDNALDFYKQALNIRRMHFDECVVADTLHCVGVLSRKANDPEFACQALLEALELRKKQKNYQETAETMLELGICYQIGSQSEKAREFISDILELLKHDDALRGKVELAIGNLKLSLGDSAGAMSSFGAALMHRAATFGKADVRTGKVALCMGLVKFLEGHSDVAIADFHMYVQTCQLAGGESLSSADFAFSLLLVGDVYSQKNDTKRAHENWTRAKAICDSRSDWTAAKAALCNMLGRRLNDNSGADPGAEKQALRIFLLLDD